MYADSARLRSQNAKEKLTVDTQVVARCVSSLVKLCPLLGAPDTGIQFGVFAGYKQDIGDQQIVPCVSSWTAPRR